MKNDYPTIYPNKICCPGLVPCLEKNTINEDKLVCYDIAQAESSGLQCYTNYNNVNPQCYNDFSDDGGGSSSACSSNTQSCTSDSSCSTSCGTGWTCSENKQCRSPKEKMPWTYILIGAGVLVALVAMGKKK